jgi:hypothetical protein
LELLDAYRRGVECGYDPPVVALRIAGDFSRDESNGVSVKAIDRGELVRIGTMAKELPEILKVPRGHFRVVATDDTDDVFAIMALPIPAK